MRLQRGVDVVPDFTYTDCRRVGASIVYDASKAAHADEDAARAGKARIRVVTTTFDLLVCMSGGLSRIKLGGTNRKWDVALSYKLKLGSHPESTCYT